jgi:hypothetical protein
MNETGQSTALAAPTTARNDDKESKIGKEDNKKKVFLNAISDVEQSFLNQQKPKNPYDYIDKKL